MRSLTHKPHLFRFPRALSPWVCLCILLCINGLYSPSARADSNDTGLRVKAAYVYNFSKFIEWPASSFSDEESPFQICIFGKRTFTPYLAPLQERKIKNHPIKVFQLEDLNAARDCHILFLSLQKPRSLNTILPLQEATPVLTVSDLPNFAEQGGGIGFINHENRIRMEMNLGAIHRAGLRVNAQLIEASLRVFETGKGIQEQITP